MAHLPPDPTTPVNGVAELDSVDVVHALVTIIGRPLVALVTDVSSTQLVRTWTDERVMPEAPREIVLRYTLQAAQIILTRFDSRVVQRWLIGTNGTLGDDAPAAVLRQILHDHIRADEIGSCVLRAARAFVTG